MIKRLFLISCLAFIAMAGRAETHNVEVDGIAYTVDTEMGTAAVTGYTVRPVNVVILATVEYEGVDYPVTSIGKRAFFGRASVESVLLPDGLQCIEDSAFYGCRPMTSIVLPKSLQSIGNHAFARTKLQNIVLPEGLQAIGYGIFLSCTSLQSVTFLGSLQTIGKETFYECISLQSIVLPEGLQSIGNSAFEYCSALQSITLPSTLQSIGSYAFADSPLKGITCHAVIPPAISDDTFEEWIYASAKLTVPEGTEDAYRAADGWKLFYTSMAIESIAYTVDVETKTASVVDADPGIREADILATVEYEGVDYPVIAIGSSAFYDCSALQSVALPEMLQTIGFYAFQNCSALQSITLPERLQDICGSAFSGCPLKEIVCHSATPPAIDDHTFDADIYSEAVLTVPAGTRVLYQSAFGWSNFFDKVTVDGIVYNMDAEAMSAAVVGYEGALANAHVLESIHHEGLEYVVVAISEKAFANCSSLQSVILPEGVQTIGDYAFSYCSALQSVTLSEGLLTIGDRAFSFCSSLQSVILPEGLQTISDWAFYYCDALKSITLPSTLQFIGAGLCESGLNEIISKAVVPPAASRSTFVDYAGVYYKEISVHVPEGAEAAYQKDQYWREFWLHPVVDDVHYTIDPDAMVASVSGYEEGITKAVIVLSLPFAGEDVPVVRIEDNAFDRCASLQCVNIPNSVIHIGSLAFWYCESLEIVNLPKSLKTIGVEAFRGCKSLASITIPEGMTTIGDHVFSYCESLRNVNLPESLQIIDAVAFRGCTLLSKINLPENLQTIGMYAFYDCISLSAVDLPQGVKTIGEKAFFNCSLEGVSSHSFVPPAISEDSFDSITYARVSLSVPVGAEDAYRQASGWSNFYRYMAIDGIAYTRNEETRTAAVVDADLNITAASIHATVNMDGYNYPVTAIGDNAFFGCDILETVVIPEGVVVIGESAFHDCTLLANITLPSTLCEIGEYAFSGCAFESIAVPEGVGCISNGVFSGCWLLRDVTLPATLQEVGSGAFSGCELSDVTSYALIPPVLDAYAFDKQTYVQARLHVPAEAEAAYCAADKWMYFSEKAEVDGITYALNPYNHTAVVFTGPWGVASVAVPAIIQHEGIGYTVNGIGIDAFYDENYYGESVLSDIVLPETILFLDERAFMACKGLTKLDLPEGLVSIGYRACFDLELKDIHLPSTLREIGEDAFGSCGLLESIIIPEGVTSIGESAFSSCSSLASVTLPSTLKTIGGYAFGYSVFNCLTDITCYAAIPPVIDKDTFCEDIYSIATLHVPSDAVDNYQSAEYWNEFLYIEGDLPSASISPIHASEASIAAYADGVITTATPATINVYAQSGARVMHAADATMLSLESLPRGIYIINVEAGTERQVMKIAR